MYSQYLSQNIVIFYKYFYKYYLIHNNELFIMGIFLKNRIGPNFTNLKRHFNSGLNNFENKFGLNSIQRVFLKDKLNFIKSSHILFIN